MGRDFRRLVEGFLKAILIDFERLIEGDTEKSYNKNIIEF